MSFNYKKHVKAISYTLLICLFATCALSLILLFFYSPIYKPAAYTMSDVLNVKDYKFQQRDKSKKNLFIVSGSNSALGISTLILEKKFNYNICNLATHSWLPLSFHLNLVKKYAQKGDIIVAPLEYDYLSRSNELNQWIYDQFTTWAVEYQSFLSPEIRKKIFINNMFTYWQRLPNLFKPPPIMNKDEIIHSINNDNSIFANKTYEVVGLGKLMDLPSTIQEKAEYFLDATTSASFISELEKFNTYFKKQSIKFYVTAPPSIKNVLFDVDTQETQEHLKNYKEIFKNLNIIYFGTDQFYNIDLKYFYDTRYHLNATGAILRTLLLTEDINTYVLGKKPSYDIQSKQARDEFFQQKELETLEIMGILREKNEKLVK